MNFLTSSVFVNPSLRSANGFRQYMSMIYQPTNNHEYVVKHLKPGKNAFQTISLLLTAVQLRFGDLIMKILSSETEVKSNFE